VSPLLLRAVVGAADRGRPPAADLTFVAAGRVGLWASRLERRAELGPAEMLAHHALVEAICAAGPGLPVRLGSWVESEAEARRQLTAREEGLVAALARVAGKVELAVSWLWREEGTQRGPAAPVAPPPDAALGPPPGTRYLLRRRLEIARREERVARAAALTRLVEAAAGVSGASAQHRVCPSDAVALSSALLVERAAAEPAIGRVRAAASQRADVELVVNGPWPPYSFAGI
jgi:Gas vesicle synthesis protein GvpL/GvpF